MKKTLLILGGIIIVGVLVWVANYLAIGRKNVFTSGIGNTISTPRSNTKAVPYTVEVVAENLYVPWSIVFTSPERMLVTERSGAIRAVEKGKLVTTPVYTFSDISTRSEEGLMGLAIDPSYEENNYVYAAVAYPQNGGLAVRIIRFTDTGNTWSNPTTLIDNLPAAANHAGTRLRFGPDGKLYITTGDASNRQIAQDLESLGGKILRVNADGTIPSDNPFPNSPVWSYGHRNSQGIDWHPDTKELYSTEHGPSGFDGPAGGDEINRIEKGANYGWPVVSHENTREGMVDPLIVYTPAVAPASGMFYSGDVFPQFKNSFFFGGLRGQGVFRVVFDENDPDKVMVNEKIEDIDVGRVREITQGPDGYIYFTTSNRDGRGTERTGNDTIYRLVPKN